MTCVCAVCKQPIEMALAVKIENHVVHPGYCEEFASRNHLSESSAEEQEQLVETTLIL